MPASVSYRINGKYDASAMNKAKGGIATLEQSAKKLTGSLKGMIVGAVSIGAITKSLKDCSASFLANDKVQNQAMKSLQNNTKMTASAIKSLVKEIDGMAGYFEGSELVNATNIISKYVGTPEEIKQTLQAARDMAADGVMPLDQAAKALGQSFNGNVKSLQKMYPELKNLTEEELKNGAAVEYLANKYKGVEDAMSQTFTGRQAQFSNAVDGLKDAIGGIYQALSFEGQGSLMEPLNNITAWIEDNSNSIINFFIHLPQIAKIALIGIKDIAKRLFDPKEILTIIKKIFDFIVKDLQIIKDLAKNIFTGKGFAASYKEALKAYADAVKDLASDIGEDFSDITNQVKDDIKEILNKDLPKALQNAIDSANIGDGTGTDGNYTETTSAVSSITGLFGDLGTVVQALISSTGWLGVLIQFIGALLSDIQEKSQAVKDFLSIFSVIADKINDSNVVEFTNQVLGPLVHALSNIGTIISSVVAPVLNILAPLLGGFAKAIESFVNVIATIVTAMYNLYVDVNNLIPWNTKMSRKSYSDIWNDSEYTSSSSVAETVTSGTAASYTAARDIYVTINFSNSYVNGDSREIAISLYNEIKSAERLGLIG